MADGDGGAGSGVPSHRTFSTVVPIPGHLPGVRRGPWAHTRSPAGSTLPHTEGDILFISFFLTKNVANVTLRIFFFQLLGLYNQWTSFLKTVRIFLAGKVSKPHYL